MMGRLPHPVRRLGARLLGAVPVRIRNGPNATYRWSLASSGRGYVRGTFERERINAILSLLRSGDVFWDIGAHKGYVSLAAARAVGTSGRVIAFEPSAVNRTFLRRHVAWNSLRTVEIVPVALSDSDGEAAFGGSGSSITFRVGRGDERVETRTIRSLLENDGKPLPDVVKIDAEGSEAAILRGGLHCLPRHALIWISVHGHDLHEELQTQLHAHGFHVHESRAMASVSRAKRLEWGGDKELLAVGPSRRIGRPELASLRLFTG